MIIYAENKSIKVGFVLPNNATIVKIETLAIIDHRELIWVPIESYWYLR